MRLVFARVVATAILLVYFSWCPANGMDFNREISSSRPSHARKITTCNPAMDTSSLCASCVAHDCKEIIRNKYGRARCALALAFPGSASCHLKEDHLIRDCKKCFIDICAGFCNFDKCQCCSGVQSQCTAEDLKSCENSSMICQQAAPSNCPSNKCHPCTTSQCNFICGAPS